MKKKKKKENIIIIHLLLLSLAYYIEVSVWAVCLKRCPPLIVRLILTHLQLNVIRVGTRVQAQQPMRDQILTVGTTPITCLVTETSCPNVVCTFDVLVSAL
jgi:hypothetical protein